ncbi:MAG TPA: type II secretion system F family protein [Gammaproteobacteria bacterium]|nr:type II secretion system F family protein [Gammaproteobacteria bacterium]
MLKKLLFHLIRHITSFKNTRPIALFDITIFFRQFATLIAAGIPIIQCCETLAQSQQKIALRQLIYALKRDILSGKNLFFSVSQHKQYFNNITCHLINLGEQTGKLDSMLIIIAQYHEKNLAFKKQLQQILFYPAIIMIIACIVTFGIFIFILPRFAELFQTSQQPLPSFTQWLFFFSTLLRQYSYLFFFPLFTLAALLCYQQPRALIKKQGYRIIQRLPVIKPFLKKILLAKFFRHLTITISAGLPITQALALAAATHHPQDLQITITQLRYAVMSGLPLHHSMASTRFFSHLMIQMVKVGEESGMLTTMLDKIADFLEADVNQLINQLNHLLEPLIMIILGVLIGGLVIGMYLPVFQLGNTL